MGKKEIKLETSLPLEQAVDYLAALVSSLRQGRVVVEKGQDYLELTPAALVEVEIEAARKKDKEKFVLELTWRQEREAAPGEAALRISSKTPVPAAASAEESQEAPTGEELAPEAPAAAEMPPAPETPADPRAELVASAGTEQIAACAAAPAPAPAEPAETGQGPRRRRKTTR